MAPLKRSADSINGNSKRHDAQYLTSNASRFGEHELTLAHNAEQMVKNATHPVSIAELGRELFNGSSSAANSLIPLFQRWPTIHYDPIAKTLEYVPAYSIRSSKELLAYLNSQPGFVGISVRDLKDGWPNCVATIKEMEAKNELLVLKHKKDGSPRVVWPNNYGPLHTVDDEFVTFWNESKLPPVPELSSKLSQVGLKPTSVDPATVKKTTTTQQGRKQKRPRVGKLTNTHLSKFFKDYS